MCAALIGGMTRLRREYIEAAKREGVRLKFFNGDERTIADGLGEAETIIVFTSKASHEARRVAQRHAKVSGARLILCHNCGVTSLRDCLRGDRGPAGRLEAKAART